VLTREADATVDFEAIFESTPNPYMVLDRELRVVAANAAYLRATGTRREELLGRYIFEVFPHDASDRYNASSVRMRASFERVLATGEPDVVAVIPYRVPAGSGGHVEERLWSATHTPIRDRSGQVRFVLQHTVDVTEIDLLATRGEVEAGVLGRARQAEAAFSSSEAERSQLRRLFELTPGFAAFLAGPDHVYEIANRAYLDLIGRDDVIGRPVKEVLPELAHGAAELFDQVMATGEPYVGRGVRAMIPQGEARVPVERYLDFVCQPVVASSGVVTGVFLQGQDITDQKRAESELERALRDYQFLAESVPQQLYTAGPDGLVDFVSRQSVEYFGLPVDDLLGAAWIDLIHPDDRDAVAAAWSSAVATGNPHDCELRLRRADGVYRWHLDRALAQRGDDGAVLRWFGTATDVDDARRDRDELAARAEHEQRLIGIVSHDLRNPLTTITVAATLLLQHGHLDALQARTLGRIVTAAERTCRLVHDLLDFAQTRAAGAIPVTRVDADLHALTREVVDEIQLAHPDRPIELIQLGCARGSYDVDRISQVISNLVGNAIQHGSVHAPVVVTSVGGDREALIVVHNAGPPIPPADLASVFEPFQRGRHSGGRSGGSVGLGLYIARQIVASHGGDIDVESDADAGTTFRVRLPLQGSSHSEIRNVRPG